MIKLCNFMGCLSRQLPWATCRGPVVCAVSRMLSVFPSTCNFAKSWKSGPRVVRPVGTSVVSTPVVSGTGSVSWSGAVLALPVYGQRTGRSPCPRRESAWDSSQGVEAGMVSSSVGGNSVVRVMVIWLHQQQLVSFQSCLRKRDKQAFCVWSSLGFFCTTGICCFE